MMKTDSMMHTGNTTFNGNRDDMIPEALEITPITGTMFVNSFMMVFDFHDEEKTKPWY